MIDGIIAGQINTNIETDPGTIVIQVTVPGYYAYKAKVRITKGKTNKINPKVKRKPTKQEIAAAKARKKAIEDRKRRQKIAKQRKAKQAARKRQLCAGKSTSTSACCFKT